MIGENTQWSSRKTHPPGPITYRVKECRAQKSNAIARGGTIRRRRANMGRKPEVQ